MQLATEFLKQLPGTLKSQSFLRMAIIFAKCVSTWQKAFYQIQLKLPLHPKVYEETIQAPTSVDIQKYLVDTRPGVYNLLLLPVALLLFIWSTAANEFELYYEIRLIRAGFKPNRPISSNRARAEGGPALRLLTKLNLHFLSKLTLPTEACA